MVDSKTFSQLLAKSFNARQPIPVVRLINGETFENCVVKGVGINYVEFEYPYTGQTVYVPISNILSVGSM